MSAGKGGTTDRLEGQVPTTGGHHSTIQVPRRYAIGAKLKMNYFLGKCRIQYTKVRCIYASDIVFNGIKNTISHSTHKGIFEFVKMPFGFGIGRVTFTRRLDSDI